MEIRTSFRATYSGRIPASTKTEPLITRTANSALPSEAQPTRETPTRVSVTAQDLLSPNKSL